MANLKIKKGDTVVILAGKEKGKTGEVLECFPKESKVTVKGLNMIVKHNKPRSAQDKGGIVRLEGKLDISNVMVICPNCNKATRVEMEIAGDKKVRKCKKCGAVLDSKKVVKAQKKDDKKKSDVKEVKAKKTNAQKEKSEAKENKTTEKKAKSTVSKKSTVKSEA